MHTPARLSAVLVLLCGVACSPPVAPPDDTPPEPQATALHDTIQRPIDKAKVVGDTVQSAAQARTP